MVGHALEQTNGRGKGVGSHQQRVAVGRRPSNELSANVVACSSLVLDDDRLSPSLLKLLTDRASQDIGTRARSGRNDDCDGTARRLRCGGAYRSKRHRAQDDATLRRRAKLESGESVHDVSPSIPYRIEGFSTLLIGSNSNLPKCCAHKVWRSRDRRALAIA